MLGGLISVIRPVNYTDLYQADQLAGIDLEQNRNEMRHFVLQSPGSVDQAIEVIYCIVLAWPCHVPGLRTGTNNAVGPSQITSFPSYCHKGPQ